MSLKFTKKLKCNTANSSKMSSDVELQVQRRHKVFTFVGGQLK